MLYADSASAILSPVNATHLLQAVNPPPLPLVPQDLTTDEKVAEFLGRLLHAHRGTGNRATALLPWVCDRLPAGHSRSAYGSDLAAFVRDMRNQGLDPLHITGDDLRVYKAALLAAGKSRTTVARVLSVLRGTYEQFGKKGLIDWERVRDIQDAPFGGGPILSCPAHRPRTTCQQLRATPYQATTPGLLSLRALTRVPSGATRARRRLSPTPKGTGGAASPLKSGSVLLLGPSVTLFAWTSTASTPSGGGK